LGWKPIPLAAMQEIADPFDQQERIQKKQMALFPHSIREAENLGTSK
jgi:hypothetical protein